MKDGFGVIFDMDGVLVDSNPTHKKALNRFFKEHGKDISNEFLVTRIFGRTNTEWIPEVFGDISPEMAKQIADDKEKVFRNIFDPKEAMVPGFTNFLDMLKEYEVKTALATSAPFENAEYILKGLSVKNQFDVILDSSHVSVGKPEPEIYIKAAKALGFLPEQCVVIEDSLAGVESARRAHSKVIGITTTHTTEELSGCDIVVDNFEELSFEDLSVLFTW
ncbi:MAG: HAD family phosphatase [Balneolales bacterium]